MRSSARRPVRARGPTPQVIRADLRAYLVLNLVLGAYLLERSWLRPATAGAQNRRQGYVHGLRQLGWLSLPALGLFVIGAVYEAFSLRYLVAPLVQALT